ncbi:hypothetical protein EX30DRAFT_203066 [Ascodesmis nigricans]|uniref:Uncharacterized protein n=1 Tax=Ascodesmis nigricans TaxID=341454 RepID=A0A4S2MKL8_9PEZI|nr:hypothetical protein EX30DRAFT_203066 [Ascodesmis nigricans]
MPSPLPPTQVISLGLVVQNLHFIGNTVGVSSVPSVFPHGFSIITHVSPCVSSIVPRIFPEPTLLIIPSMHRDLDDSALLYNSSSSTYTPSRASDVFATTMRALRILPQEGWISTRQPWQSRIRRYWYIHASKLTAWSVTKHGNFIPTNGGGIEQR